MTTALTPTTAMSTAAAPATYDRVAARHEALIALDSFVRPLLAEAMARRGGAVAPSIELTIYDRIYRRSTAGGHWTAAERRWGVFGHTMGSLAVTLHFDGEDRPTRFTISAARDEETPDASPESLAAALERAVRAGPLTTWAPNFAPGVSL